MIKSRQYFVTNYVNSFYEKKNLPKTKKTKLHYITRLKRNNIKKVLSTKEIIKIVVVSKKNIIRFLTFM